MHTEGNRPSSRILIIGKQSARMVYHYLVQQVSHIQSMLDSVISYPARLESIDR